jgi:transposase
MFMHLVGKDSIVVGIDVHKYTHQAVALGCFGEELGKLQFTNDEIQNCIVWLNSLGKRENIIVGLEDVNGLGIHLTRELQTAGFLLRYSPAVYTERERKHSTQQDKNDYLDAKRVGKVILTKSEETLPALHIVPQEEIRTLDLLLQEREELVRAQTALKNQLHALLHQYYGNGYKQSFKEIFTQKAIAWYRVDLRKEETRIMPDNRRFVSGSILRRFERLEVIMSQAKELFTLIGETGGTLSSVQKLTNALNGCGVLTAVKIVVEIGDVRRFQTEAKLAKYAGIAPIQSQSGKKNRYHTNPFGNRKLNKAVHTIALSQIGKSGNGESKTYYQKKVSEGKSKLWALRCLRRFVIRRIYSTLKETADKKAN